MSEKKRGWIGVDLDGTLAHYDGWQGVGHVGEPVPEMLARVREWLAAGVEVRIFTARASHDHDRAEAVAAIEAWCLEHLGSVLPVTCTKDFNMVELWDDRCIAVEQNTGAVLGGVSRARRLLP